ncbi:MAG: helix-turn-helix domain-containing protein [bacterium]|nr:helix-turn-helix domain-containing protein [bacterium]
MNIGERIKQIRKEAKLTQKDFAEALGITQANISAIEKNVSNPSLTLVKLICSVYSVNEKWLVEGIGERSSLDYFGTDEIPMLLSKFENMKCCLNDIIKKYQSDRDTLFWIEESFAYFIDILSAVKLKPSHKLDYYKNIFSIMDELGKYTFLCSTIYPQKNMDLYKVLTVRERQLAVQGIIASALDNIANICIDNAYRKDNE